MSSCNQIILCDPAAGTRVLVTNPGTAQAAGFQLPTGAPYGGDLATLVKPEGEEAFTQTPLVVGGPLLADADIAAFTPGVWTPVLEFDVECCNPSDCREAIVDMGLRMGNEAAQGQTNNRWLTRVVALDSTPIQNWDFRGQAAIYRQSRMPGFSRLVQLIQPGDCFTRTISLEVQIVDYVASGANQIDLRGNYIFTCEGNLV